MTDYKCPECGHPLTIQLEPDGTWLCYCGWGPCPNPVTNVGGYGDTKDEAYANLENAIGEAWAGGEE